MHALSKTLFFTTGSVGLLVLVFLWSALHYGLFKLNFLIDAILNYRFAGFYLTDFLQLAPSLDPGQKAHILKLVISSCIGTGSSFLILLSYLPRISWQLRSLSFVVSPALFTILSLFWICLMNGNEVIKTSEKSAIFGFTAVTYLSAVFLLWYAMRARPSKRSSYNKQSVTPKPADLPPKNISAPAKEETEEKSEEATEKEESNADSSELEQNKESEKNDDSASEKIDEPKEDEPKEGEVLEGDESITEEGAITENLSGMDEVPVEEDSSRDDLAVEESEGVNENDATDEELPTPEVESENTAEESSVEKIENQEITEEPKVA